MRDGRSLSYSSNFVSTLYKDLVEEFSVAVGFAKRYGLVLIDILDSEGAVVELDGQALGSRVVPGLMYVRAWLQAHGDVGH